FKIRIFMYSVINRRITRTLALVILAGGLLSGCDSKTVGEKEVKFVNIEQVVNESGLAAQQKTHLEAVYKSLQGTAKQAEELYKTMTPEKAAQVRQADTKALSAQWQVQMQAARQVVADQVKKSAEQYRVAHKIGAILPAQTTVSYAKDLDISTELAAQLKTEKVTFGELPELTPKIAPQPTVKTPEAKK
ncbi:hypothetical protein, partial [Rahnella aceris]|uniref:hypothetical protein n=1 Tax=Rahnella sp. (strain Y9602) TaxID=2703885 RepID=UPI001C254A55